VPGAAAYTGGLRPTRVPANQNRRDINARRSDRQSWRSRRYAESLTRAMSAHVPRGCGSPSCRPYACGRGNIGSAIRSHPFSIRPHRGELAWNRGATRLATSSKLCTSVPAADCSGSCRHSCRDETPRSPRPVNVGMRSRQSSSVSGGVGHVDELHRPEVLPLRDAVVPRAEVIWMIRNGPAGERRPSRCRPRRSADVLGVRVELERASSRSNSRLHGDRRFL